MDQRTNFVACLSWIKRGIARSTPERVQLTKEDLQRLIDDAKQNIRDVEADDNEDKEEGEVSTVNEEEKDEGEVSIVSEEEKDEDALAKYNLDQYDNDTEENNPLLNIAGLTVFASNEDDPYITAKDTNDLEEEEDFHIRPDDNLIAVGRVQEDCSILEVYVYNEEEQDLYVHHDMILPAFPLTIEWLNFDPNEETPGNYVAVGDMTPIIKVWDIDVVDALEPSYALGKKIKKTTKKPKSKHYGHKDAVLDLSWNKNARQALASGSADYRVLVWDLHDGRPVTKFCKHTEKVQSLQWHPFEPQMLLTGGCDKMTKIIDCRSVDSSHRSWTLDGEVEKVIWNHFDPFYFLVSTDQGSVYCLDARTEKPLYTIKAHHEPVTGLSLSSQRPGCLLTASMDGTVKIWDIKDSRPVFIAERNFNLGSLHALSFCPDSPLVFAVGGDNRSNNFRVCDIENFHCASRFCEDRVSNMEMEENVDSEQINTNEAANSMENLRIDFSKKGTKKKKFRQFKSKKM